MTSIVGWKRGRPKGAKNKFPSIKLAAIVRDYQEVVNTLFKTNPEFCFTKPNHLIEYTSILAPARYGNILAKFICTKMGGIPVSKNVDGDFIIGDFNYEVKVSLDDKNLGVRQIRLWQNINRYVFFHADKKSKTVHVFILSKQQLSEEVEKLEAHPTHSGGKDLSFDISLVPGDNHYERWCKKYRDKEIENLLK